MNATRVHRVEPSRIREIEERLTRAGYQFRRPPAHARFQARGEGVTVTLYLSGKLVVQGRGAELWGERYLGGAAAAEPARAKRSAREEIASPLPAALLGSDEAGKGDTFGPLVVAAVAVDERALLDFDRMRLADSKTLSEERVRILAPQIRERAPSRERVLAPADYNEARHRHGDNVNHLLAALHAELLEDLYRETGLKTAVVDRFAGEQPVRRLLGERAPELEVHEVPRAEEILAVAAASILARDRFLEGLRGLEEEWAVDLARGSGPPAAKALRRFLQVHGPGPLEQVAKLHFRNVQAALEAHGRG